MAARPSPWNLGGLTVRELARRVLSEISADEVTDRAAALAYYFVFALFPTLLFLTALLGMFPLPGLMDRLFQYIDSALPPDAASVTRKTLDEIQRYAHGGLLSAGALGALWASSNGMALSIDRGSRGSTRLICCSSSCRSLPAKTGSSVNNS